MVQYVGGTLEVYESEGGDEKPETKILFLGKDINKDELEEKLMNCLNDQAV